VWPEAPSSSLLPNPLSGLWYPGYVDDDGGEDGDDDNDGDDDSDDDVDDSDDDDI
jgi:hypothetical protein